MGDSFRFSVFCPKCASWDITADDHNLFCRECLLVVSVNATSLNAAAHKARIDALEYGEMR